MTILDIHYVSKKFPPLSSLQLCQILTSFQSVCTAGKHTKFATKPIRQYPCHIRHVDTLFWEIRNLNFLHIISRYGKMQTNCILVASNFVIHPQILTLSVFKIASLSPY